MELAGIRGTPIQHNQQCSAAGREHVGNQVGTHRGLARGFFLRVGAGAIVPVLSRRVVLSANAPYT